MRSTIFITLLITALVLTPVTAVFAHSPVFPEANHDPSTAYEVHDPAKSWAIYTELEDETSGDYYTFSVARGERIQVSLLVPDNPSKSGFLPSFALLIPDTTQTNNAPAYVEVPGGYGVSLVNGTDPGQATYEPFSPGWFYEVADLNMDAPTEGTYYVVVFQDNHNDDTGSHTHGATSYGLVVGYIESFTPLELILVPYSAQQIYIWEGQSQCIVLLPMILVIVIGGVMLFWRSRRVATPQGLSKWLAAVAGLAFLGSAVGVIYQMLKALSTTGTTTEAFITLVLAILPIVLGVVTLLYAVRVKPTLTLRRRVVLIATGIIALFVWAGLYLGPAMVIAAALVPPYLTKRNRALP